LIHQGQLRFFRFGTPQRELGLGTFIVVRSLPGGNPHFIENFHFGHTARGILREGRLARQHFQMLPSQLCTEVPKPFSPQSEIGSAKEISVMGRC
jgi:hypothetical protein